jgi:fatty-acyl-CoA synthase
LACSIGQAATIEDLILSSTELTATPTNHSLAFRAADFPTLTAALDYAAQGETGANFYTGRGAIYSALPYRELRSQAVALAHKLLGLGLEPGSRVALVAETNPDFLCFFYACQYAGLVPLALPASVKMGAHLAYVAQLQRLLEASDRNYWQPDAETLAALQGAADELEDRLEGIAAE